MDRWVYKVEPFPVYRQFGMPLMDTNQSIKAALAAS